MNQRFKNKVAEENAAESNKSRLLEEDDNSEKSGDFSSTNLKFRNNIKISGKRLMNIKINYRKNKIRCSNIRNS